MKKVAIASCYYQHNYGSMLQAYATQMALDKLGVENETIDISGFNKQIQKAKIKYFAKAALTSDILLSKAGMAENVIRMKISRDGYSEKITQRDKKFKQFSEEHFRLSKPCSLLTELGGYTDSHYSAVIVGSDQLWLPGNIAADYFTLNWVPDSINKIAYATSFGQSSLPRNSSEKAKLFLNRINHIGIREESGQKLIEQLTGRQVPVVCDPSLLFTGEEWLEIQKEEPIIKGPYIFVYFLGNNPPHREFVKKLKAETGCKIIALVHLVEYVKSDEEYADYTPYDIDPTDFLNLIRNASYVCTDSFHCSVFSMQYEKTFFSFRRYARKTASSTNSRLDTLFKLAGVKDKILSGNEEVKECLARKIDYKVVLRNLENIRVQSYEYLKAALADERNTDL